MVIRHLEEADYEKIIGVLNDWWGGRQMADMLPRLFFKHFKETSFEVFYGRRWEGQGNYYEVSC